MKSKVIALAEKVQTDNFNISHKAVRISGFPFKWRITVRHPVFSYTDMLGTTEAHLKQIVFDFAFGLKTTHIDFGSSVDFKRSLDEDKEQSYRLHSDNPLLVDLVTYRRVYEIDDSKLAPMNVVRSCTFLTDYLIFEGEDNQLFELDGVKLFADKDLGDNVDTISVSIRGGYSSEGGFLGFNKASINTIMTYKINYALEEEREFDHKIKITRSKLEIDDSKLKLAGELILNHTSLPKGKFEVAIKKYKKMVDTIIPDDFFISKSYIKELLAGIIMKKGGGTEALPTENAELVKFDVVFTEDGVRLD